MIELKHDIISSGADSVSAPVLLSRFRKDNKKEGFNLKNRAKKRTAAMLTACLTLLSVFTACSANETSYSSAVAQGTVSGMTETTVAAVETTQTTAEESTKETMKETTKETTEPAAEEGQTGEILRRTQTILYWILPASFMTERSTSRMTAGYGRRTRMKQGHISAGVKK